jgi:hypothetical protein
MTRVAIREGNPLDITLAAYGGTLKLSYSAPLMQRGESTYLRNHEGAVLGARVFEQWSALQGALSGERDGDGASTLVVPQMEAGEYAVCRVSQAEFPGFVAGSPLQDSCSWGTLRPGQELEIVTPASRLASQ